MRSSGDVPPTSPSSRGSSSHNDNSSGNSGSQYALCALGVGLVALGVVMVVWSVVPADPAGNSSSGGGGTKPSDRSKASSVAFVLVGSGVIMLLLSLCLGMRNKRREQQRLQESQNHAGAGVAADNEDEDGETAEERAQRYNVPSYEEVVGSSQWPVRQSDPRHSTSQLPSYDDLVQVDSVQVEFEGTEVSPTGAQPPATAASSAGPAAAANAAAGRRPGKTSRKLLPLKIRRIKSEKLHMKNADNSQPPGGVSIEPLTPPPQYEDKVPPLRD